MDLVGEKEPRPPRVTAVYCSDAHFFISSAVSRSLECYFVTTIMMQWKPDAVWSLDYQMHQEPLHCLCLELDLFCCLETQQTRQPALWAASCARRALLVLTGNMRQQFGSNSYFKARCWKLPSFSRCGCGKVGKTIVWLCRFSPWRDSTRASEWSMPWHECLALQLDTDMIANILVCLRKI